MSEPRYCKVCGEEIVRRVSPEGRKELASQFEKRIFCSLACLGVSRRKNLCVVCGELPYGRIPGGQQCCKNTACQALFMVHPQLADPRRRQKNERTPKRTKEPLSRVLEAAAIREMTITDVPSKQMSALARLAEALSIDPATLQVDRSLHFTADEQGLDGCTDDVWSYLSRVSCLIRILNKEEGSAGITIEPGNKTVPQAIIEDVLNNSGSEDLCDIFYAWRCGCPKQHTLEYPTVYDLPNRGGWHTPCPICGSSPIEVRR